jgi:hypothetical protein
MNASQHVCSKQVAMRTSLLVKAQVKPHGLPFDSKTSRFLYHGLAEATGNVTGNIRQ